MHVDSNQAGKKAMRLFDWALIIFVVILTVAMMTYGAHSKERQNPPQRAQLYDSKGNYKGYVKESPYSGRCCNIYDSQGRLTGAVRQR